MAMWGSGNKGCLEARNVLRTRTGACMVFSFGGSQLGSVNSGFFSTWWVVGCAEYLVALRNSTRDVERGDEMGADVSAVRRFPFPGFGGLKWGGSVV
jgi:hypothetical protein